MDYHVNNNSHVDKAFKVRGGHTVVAAGKEAEVVDAKELTEAQIDGLDREGVKVNAKGGEGKSEEKTDAPTVEAKHRGGGSYSIMQGDTELVEKLTKEDAEAFNAMSDEDKAAYVEAAKK